MRRGLAALGIQAYIFDDVSKELLSLSNQIDAYTSQEPYKAGHKDGYQEAFGTGLIE